MKMCFRVNVPNYDEIMAGGDLIMTGNIVLKKDKLGK